MQCNGKKYRGLGSNLNFSTTSERTKVLDKHSMGVSAETECCLIKYGICELSSEGDPKLLDNRNSLSST